MSSACDDHTPRMSTDDSGSQSVMEQPKPLRSTGVLPTLPSKDEFGGIGIDMHDSIHSLTLENPRSDKYGYRVSESGLLRDNASGAMHINKAPTRVPSEHWRNGGDAFRHEEEIKRNENLHQAVMHFNDNGWTHTRLFFSHCWRDATTQEHKRMLFAAMTNRGSLFWADFLDLQAQGPVPWRREIGDAIQTASKFVAVIDLQYLLSFNCLEELEYAIHHSKPIVVAMLDQESWNLLTVIGGAKSAWEMKPAGDARSLDNYDGQAFGPGGKPFDLHRVEHIFSTIASINFCPCRPLDIAALGAGGVSKRLCIFVEKDLDYTKEHAFLQSKAEAWEEAEKPTQLLLEGQADVNKWKDWANIAQKAEFFPPVTDLQSAYLHDSVERYNRRRSVLRSLKIGAVAVIFLLMVIAFFLLAWALRQQVVVVANADRANLYASAAEEHAAFAKRQGRMASAMLLASSTAPESSSEIRAVVRAAEISQKIGFTALILPYLQSTLEYLVRQPFWFADMNSHTSPVNTVAYSPDGLRMASGGIDKTIWIVPVQPHQGATWLPPFDRGAYIEAPGIVLTLTWSPSGRLLAAGLDNRDDAAMPVIVLWRKDESNGCWEELFRIPRFPGRGSSADVRALAWSPNSEILASGNEDDDDQQVMWYIGEAIRSGRDQPEFLVPEYGAGLLYRVRTLAFSPDGRKLAVGGTNNKALLFDVSDMPPAEGLVDGISGGLPPPMGSSGYVPRHIGFAEQNDDITSVAFSADGTLLAVGGDIGRLGIHRVPPSAATDDPYVYRVRSNLPLPFVYRELPNAAEPYSGNGTELPIFFGPPLEMIKAFPGPDDFDSSTDNIDAMAWSGNGEMLLATASQDDKVRLYRRVESTMSKNSMQEGIISLVAVLETPDLLNSLAIQPSAKNSSCGLVSAAMESSVVRSWMPAANIGRNGPEWFNLDCVQPIEAAFGKEFSPRGTSFSPDGNSFVASSYRGHICAWDRNGSAWDISAVLGFPQKNNTADPGRKASRAVVFSLSGNRFVAGDDASGLHGWQRSPSGSWEVIGHRYFNDEGVYVRAVAWSWDEKWVVGAGRGGSGVWNIYHERSQLQEFKSSATVYSAAWRNGLDEEGCYVLATGEALTVLRIRKLCPVAFSDWTVTLVESAVIFPSKLQHDGDILALAWSSTGLLASGTRVGMMAIHTYEQGNVTDSMLLAGHSSKIRAIAWAPGGMELATSSNEDVVIVWDLRSDQTGQDRGFTSWMSLQSCHQLKWLDQKPQRLACGRRSESGVNPLDLDPPFSYSLMFSLLDFDHQLSIMQELQYGSLDASDLIRLGLYDVASTALDTEMFPLQEVKAKSAQCPSKRT